jgi:class 3 adenylate cyclase
MAACPSCGRESPQDARFCGFCGAALVAAVEPPRETRKVVTVLFCDVVGSTALGEATDPEALRARMRRYFDDLRRIVERHGGTVEKFAGDAIMAVFGIPAAHEDDALRTVRAASEMRAAIAEHGLEARIGVNTGEVVAGGTGETLVTGDAVNVAARLEQAAPPGETLIGAETRVLVRAAVRAEPVEPLVLKGKSEPVDAFRLLELLTDADGVARRLETPLVGRERERQRLWRDYEDAVAGSTCRLFTLLGPAGIGKSRLVADFLERVGDSADVLRGRCLSYGEGITYWPLVEMLAPLGIDPETRRRIDSRGDASRVPPPARGSCGGHPAGDRRRRPAVGGAGVSSTSSSTSPTSRGTHRSSCSSSRAPSCSTADPVGVAGSSTPRRSSSSLSGKAIASASSTTCLAARRLTSRRASASQTPPTAYPSSSRRCSRWCVSAAQAREPSTSRPRSTRYCKPASMRSRTTSGSS